MLRVLEFNPQTLPRFIMVRVEKSLTFTYLFRGGFRRMYVIAIFDAK